MRPVSGQTYSIDQLSALFDLPSSTIRMYQAQRLLPPPSRQGRRAVYDEAHVDRLTRILELKRNGYSLAAIRHLFAALASGVELSQVLAHPDLVEAVQLESINPAMLTAEIFGPETQFDPSMFRKAVELGLVEFSADGSVQVNRRGLELGAKIVRLGIPPSVALEELEALLALTDEIAARFAKIYEKHVVSPTQSSIESQTLYEQLVVLARQTVDYALRRSLARNESDLAQGEGDRGTSD